MGLVARKDFLGEGGRKYKAGEPCDEALRWRYPALRACLNQGIIEDTDGMVERHFAPKGRIPPTPAERDAAVQRRAQERRERLAGTQARLEPVAAAPEAQPDSVEDDGPTDVQTMTLEKQHGCKSCSKVFISEHALRIHEGKAHRG